MSQAVILQNLLDFTVQIRTPDKETIVGTGVIISPYQVITCAHVVESAIDIHPNQAGESKIVVYFPSVGINEKNTRLALVESCFPEDGDDIVSLRLIDGPAPLGPEKFAVLGLADNCLGHEFYSYGFSPTGPYPATWAMGRILGSLPIPQDKNLHLGPIQLSSQEIDHGMSGAAVLDKEKNLIIGLVAERYFPKTWTKGDIAYAVDTQVLTFNPFCFKLRKEPLPLRPAPSIRIDVTQTEAAARTELDIAWNNAPALIQEWVGREDLLKAITSDWVDSKKRITGLIGFGGEGKSSLARRWIDDLLEDTVSPQPDGAFWWGFYDRPSVDEFFETALNYLSGGNTDMARLCQSSSARVRILAGMIHGGRYLFVLDGLEVLQHEEGDHFGLLKSNDLREFLQFFASPDHDSFCIVTSRVPLLEFMEYTTYQHRDVERLNAYDSRVLLKKLDVKGDDAELDKVVADWDGHALTLSLIGSYIADQYGGDISHIKDIPPPTADEPRYERVHRVLKRYDKSLSDEEREFLRFFSAFRTPIDKKTFNGLFRSKAKGNRKKTAAIIAHLAAMSNAAFDKMVKRLVGNRILRFDCRSSKYNTHALVRSHYHELLMRGDRTQAIEVHRRIQKYYLAKAEDLTDNPKLDNLKPLIEAVYHACQSGDYGVAIYTLWMKIYQQNEFYIYHKLGAYETDLAILQEFFPNGDTSQDPLVSGRSAKGWILNEMGYSSMCLGRLNQAEQFLERAYFVYINITKERSFAGRICQNLSQLYALMGALVRSSDCARQALELSTSEKNKFEMCSSNSLLAFAEHLQGDLENAREDFKKAEVLEREIDRTNKYLYSLSGVHHSKHLMQIGNAAYARSITDANLKICESYHWLDSISSCHRVLGDLDANSGEHNTAVEHYTEALKIARVITHRALLIEGLLARGRWAAKHMKNVSDAFSDLDEALNYAVTSGFRIFEADIRMALAWAQIAASNKEKARAEVVRAKQMSEDMGYYWGKKDADEVLAEIEKA
jgi:tetratricopeptide (TPR) repeat protein